MSDPIPAAEVENRIKQLHADFDAFVTRVQRGDYRHVVVMFGGTTFIQGVRANRPIRLTKCLAEEGTPVLFNFHRWTPTQHIPDYDGGLVLQSPIDQTPQLVERLLVRDLGATLGVFIVSYPHPSVCRLVTMASANGWVTLYDARDDWEEFEKVGMANWYRKPVEQFVVDRCDTTCCVSRPLQTKLGAYTERRTVRLSPNAYDPGFLAPGYQHRPGDQIVIGYFGHLTNRWFDWESLTWIARQRPEYRFEIIGHGAPEDLDLPRNMVLLGPKTHPEICKLAARWHVGIIPFRPSRLADGVDPIKIYEYFGLGLPVVSLRMPQIADYPYTQTVDTPEAFLDALDDAIDTEPDPAVLDAFLTEHTWANRAAEMLRWADNINTKRQPSIASP